MRQAFLPFLLATLIGVLSAAETPSVERSPEDACWGISLTGLLKAEGRMNVYAIRRDGRWIAATASTGYSGANRFNTSKHVVDMSKLVAKDGRHSGLMVIHIAPDPWVPFDHKTREVRVQVDFTTGPKPEKDANAIASVSGTYQREAITGEADGNYDPAPRQGSIGGAIGPTDIKTVPEMILAMTLHVFLPGGRPIDGARKLSLSIGLKDGKPISAITSYTDAHHKPFGDEYQQVPTVTSIDRDGFQGVATFPVLSLDGEMLSAEVTFNGGRVQGMVTGRWKAIFRPLSGPGETFTSEGLLEGSANPGIQINRYAADPRPWFTAVPGWKAPEPGEHPRLFFRKAEVATLRERAATPEGQQIIARLRQLLNGSDGQSLPKDLNPSERAYSGKKFAAPLGSYTISHAAGFGFLYQITGETKYADLARQCVEMAWNGQRDLDERYSWKFPNGQLRAGPTLGWYAVAYDLCYDAWPADFRKKMAQALLNYDEIADPKSPVSSTASATKIEGEIDPDEKPATEGISLRRMLLSPAHGPASNHFGPIIGGSGLAVMAVLGDEGVDSALTTRYLRALQVQIERAVTTGFGDGGFFAEGHGPGQIGTDTAFVPCIQAMRSALGRDYCAPRPNFENLTLLRVWELIGSPAIYPYRSAMGGSYGSAEFHSLRDGLSRGGQFVQGFGLVRDEHKPALLWMFENVIEPGAGKRTFDTISPYPHRPMLALINWPFGQTAKNPETVLPKVHRDTRFEYVVFRNRWKDKDDTVVSMLGLTRGKKLRPSEVMVWGRGLRLTLPGVNGDISDYRPGKDGSGQVATEQGKAIAVDYSGTSGAETLVVVTGGKADVGKAKAAKATPVKIGDTAFVVLTIAPDGNHPEVKTEGDAIVAGKQRITWKDGRLTLATFTAAP